VRVVGYPSLWQDNGLKCLKSNLVRGRVKPIDNDFVERKRLPQAHASSESDWLYVFG